MKKNMTWLIVGIMGLALAISIIYSLVLNHKINSIEPEKIVTSTSIVQTTVSRVSIENTLSGNGKIIREEKDYSDIIDEQGQVIGKITNEKDAKINLTIEKMDKEKLKKDLEISIKEKDSTKKYNGIITNVESVGETNCTISITFDEPMLLEKDTVVECKVILEKAENVIAVPVEAIQKSEDGKKYVIVINDDETTTNVDVETGLSDPSYIEITNGLNGGEKIQLKTSTTVKSNSQNEINK